jgi:excisionase family DNA binding protein
MEKKLLRPVEVALLLGISRSLLYVMLTRNELPSVLIHKARRIPVAAVDAYIEDRLAQQQAERQAEQHVAQIPPAPQYSRPTTHRQRRTTR